MSRAPASLTLTRVAILRYRQRVGALDTRRPMSAASLRLAAWAGLQDSTPRAALFSIHARVRGATPSTWEHPSLVQLWGPRFSDYVVAAKDLPVFSLARLPDHPRRATRAHDTAARLHACLRGRRLPFGLAGKELGVPANSLRYAAPTGTVLLRWDGAHQPVVWTVPPPAMAPMEARRELARRYLHACGPSTVDAFSRWAGIGSAEARLAFRDIADELVPTRTPIGDAWLLAADEDMARASADAVAPARLLPSGDAYYLLWGRDRELLVPDARRRAELWTTRVWPGAVLAGGEIVGVWRRTAGRVSVSLWRRLTAPERAAVEEEACSLPLHERVSVEIVKTRALR